MFNAVLTSTSQVHSCTSVYREGNSSVVKLCACGVSMSICEKTTTLIFLDLELVHHFITETCNIISVHLPSQSNTSPLYTCHWSRPLNYCFHFKVKVKVILWPTGKRPVCLGVRHPSGTRDQFFSSLLIVFRQLRVCWCEAPSLTRSRVCSFQFLPGIASAAFLRSESHGTRNQFFFLLENFLNSCGFVIL
jgi:hypothetical protein